MNEKLISIVVPAYNVEKYLGICMDSICMQTYSNLEIILVDDGSTDSTGKICDKYANKDDRIVVIHHEKCKGLSCARNEGIKMARGRYIAFVDSDDYVSEDMIEKLYYFIQNTNSDIAVCNYQIVTDNGEKSNIYGKVNEQLTILREENKYDLIYMDPRYGIVAWNKLYKKEIFQNIEYPVGKKHEDNYIIHKILEKANQICCSQEIVYFYRMRDNSITANVSQKNFDEDLEACYERILFYEKRANNKYLNKALCEYMSRIISVYYVSLKRWKNDLEYREKLKLQYYYAYSKLCWKCLTLKNKMNYKLFMISPFLGAHFQKFILSILARNM